MRIWIVVLISMWVVVLGSAASAEMVQGQATTVEHPMLSVSGTGTVEVAPDTLRVTASVITEGDTVEAARERNAQIVQKAMAAVEALKLAKAATKTLDYTLERVTQTADVDIPVDLSELDVPWKKIGPSEQMLTFHLPVPVTLGYRATNSLTVRLQGTRDELSEGAGKVVDALMASGCNQITSVAYSLESRSTAAFREALTKAMKDAQMTAEAVAEAAGRKIVGIRNISPGYVRPAYEMRNVQASFGAGRGGYGGYAEPATPTSVTAGMLEATATVQVNYQLDYNPGDTEFLPAAK